MMQWDYRDEYEDFYHFPAKSFVDNVDEEGNLQDTDRFGHLRLMLNC